MSIGLIGRKAGMTRVFNDEGRSVPVSVIEVDANVIARLKTVESDGYTSVVVTTGKKHAGRVPKAEAGLFAKAGIEAGLGLWEFRVAADELVGYEIGQALTVEMFAEVNKVDVTGTTKGKGFQGGVKRHNFRTQDTTHGNSLSHRANGSIGQNQTPGRVFKGKKMSGHMGHEQQTTQNLTLVRVDAEKGYLLVEGAVPGPKGGTVKIKPAVKG